MNQYLRCIFMIGLINSWAIPWVVAEISVEGASLTWKNTLVSAQFPPIPKRITLEYASTQFNRELVGNNELIDTLDELPPRITVEYASQVYKTTLVSPIPINEFQRVEFQPSQVMVGLGGEANLGLFYAVSDNNNQLPGIGIRVHFDSSQLTWLRFDNVFNTDLVGKSVQAEPDSSDFDHDPTTDQYVSLSWLSQLSQWPNTQLPRSLANVVFQLNPNAMLAGEQTTLNLSASSVARVYEFSGNTATVTAGLSCNLDIDDSGETDALTDGLLIIRHLFGFGGESLIAGAVSPHAHRTTSAAIGDYFQQCSQIYDIDGNNQNDALTDGLLAIRYLFGFSGDSLINGATATNCTRCDKQSIESYLASLRVGSSLQRQVRGKMPTETDWPQQIITPLPKEHYAPVGDWVTTEIEYNTSDGMSNLSGLGLNIYYDSRQLDCENGFSELATPQHLVSISNRHDDVANGDHHSETDSMLVIAWLSLEDQWPDFVPIKLFDLSCELLDNLAQTTQIYFTGGSTASGYRLNPASVTVNRLP